MQNTCFEAMREEVLSWYRRCISRGAEYMELTKNKEEAVVIDLSFRNCLAQIAVCNQTYAPYSNVSFEAATLDSKTAIESGQPELIYFWYDTENTTKENVVEELNKGVDYCVQYIPNLLEKEYLNQRGVIFTGKENVSKIVHPDDLSKLARSDLDEEYICVGVQSQYLVIENRVKTIRVLAEFFDCI